MLVFLLLMMGLGFLYVFFVVFLLVIVICKKVLNIIYVFLDFIDNKYIKLIFLVKVI